MVGPGQRNSLIMSNNAAGFLHFTLNTRKRIYTFLGSFERQLISGKLECSGINSPKTDFIIDGIDYELPKRQWRYVNGLTINYQPKWVPGLFLGLNRVIQVYWDELGHGFTDYFPIFTPFQKKNPNGEEAKNRDQLASFFFRWVIKNQNSSFMEKVDGMIILPHFWDFFESPEHSRAYFIWFY